MAPSATLSWPITGEILEPQLSDPTHRKWPVWLFLLAAARTRLQGGKKVAGTFVFTRFNKKNLPFPPFQMTLIEAEYL